MKNNNKGMTLVEVIICITLISIVAIFLFNILASVNKQNKKSQTQSNLLINQALIIQAIETDFIDYQLENISKCLENEIKDIIPDSADKSTLHCIKLTYNSTFTSENNGYLLFYNYEYSKQTNQFINVVGYIRGDTKVIRQTSVDPTLDENQKIKAITGCSESICFLKIKLPLLLNNQDYGINLSYTYNEAEFAEISPGNYDYNLIIIKQ